MPQTVNFTAMARNPTSLNKLLSRHAPLRRWLEDAQAQSLLMDQLIAQLPSAIRPHCLGARLDEDTLVVLADSAAWATRLRYEVPRVLDQFGARNLRIRVVPADKQPPDKARAQPSLPAEAAKALEQTAETVDDPELATVLRRLAKHRRNSG